MAMPPADRCDMRAFYPVLTPMGLSAVAGYTTRHRAFAEQPALRPSTDTMMAGRELGASRRPVGPHGHELFAQDSTVTLAPGDRLPAVLREGLEHGLGRIERGGARLLRLAASPRTR